MALMRGIFAVMLLALAGSVVAAGIEVREFDDPVMEQRYRDLTASMRCPLCENQAIDDSDAPISGDMRERVYQLLQDGQSDIEIINHMVQRFGSTSSTTRAWKTAPTCCGGYPLGWWC